MIKRRTLGVVAAAALLGGLGTYGATTAFASPDASPLPASSATSSPSPHGHGKGTESMIRHCIEHVPADQRGKAEKEMREMMSDHDDMPSHSRTGGTGAGPMSGMMNGSSAGSMAGMMRGAEDGS